MGLVWRVVVCRKSDKSLKPKLRSWLYMEIVKSNKKKKEMSRIVSTSLVVVFKDREYRKLNKYELDGKRK